MTCPPYCNLEAVFEKLPLAVVLRAAFAHSLSLLDSPICPLVISVTTVSVPVCQIWRPAHEARARGDLFFHSQPGGR